MSESKEVSFRTNDSRSSDDRLLEDVLQWIHWTGEKLSSKISLDRTEQVVQDILHLFRGRFAGYRACDTRYHNVEHTFLLFPPFCQLAVALHKNQSALVLPRDIELGLVAVLLHDTGYICSTEDCSGTGAKYTFRHIDRSISFAYRYLPSLGYQEDDLVRVKQMISCTGIRPHLEQIDFVSDGCRLLGYALGTADLLAQMSDHRYPEKLPLLFLEFQEAYRYEGPEQLEEMEVYQFKSSKELIQKTPLFYKDVVHKRLEAMGSVCHLLEDPETGKNPYLEKIEKNMEVLTA